MLSVVLIGVVMLCVVLMNVVAPFGFCKYDELENFRSNIILIDISFESNFHPTREVDSLAFGYSEGLLQRFLSKWGKDFTYLSLLLFLLASKPLSRGANFLKLDFLHFCKSSTRR
jgi:hypothetical protein